MATTTYTPIETYTVSGSSTTSVTLGSGGTIPQTYTDLIIVINGKNTSANSAVLMQFNGDTTTNYSFTYLYNNSSQRQTNQTSGWVGDINTNSSTDIVQIMNYSNSTTYKTYLSRNANPDNVSAIVGLWRKTPEAITSITLNITPNNFASGTTITLYGIANAAIGAPKATGGIITYDNTYYYHTFGASGTFTPQQNLTNVDYLVIAGGGSGGGTIGYSGGGGAGGLRSTVDATGGGGSLESKLSLTSGTAYTITVGAGGSPGSGGGNSSIAGSGLTTITSVGGGCAGYYNGSVYINPTSGGSGGGGSASGSGSSTIGGAGTANQGYAGGTSSGSAASGGGGAASVGGNGSTGVAGIGGSALTLTTFATVTGTGVNNKYAGGGGAIVNSQNIQSVGGGGGAGNGNYAGTGVSATANTGSGGGGGSSNGGSGGSGVVVIRYAKA